jgi:hypothetical protein
MPLHNAAFHNGVIVFLKSQFNSEFLILELSKSYDTQV